MKKILFILILTFGYSKITFGQSEEAQIKKTMETFFEGMYKRDTMLIKSVLHKNCSLNSVNIKPDQAATQKSESIGGFLKSISTIPQNVVLEERLLNHKIQIDEALAIDWTPYEFYVNQKLSHQGTNVFTLIKTENTWRIFAIIDTRKR
ncbi:MAG: nuclear transport factor 2 family protein [Leadbetterella sp.]|nr:nuclear transport factor 2 family protein [Leadbetterella sp.]